MKAALLRIWKFIEKVYACFFPKHLPSLRIGKFTAKVCIIQGGMGVKNSGCRLASAVDKQGGIGVIATADIGADEPDFHKDPLATNIRALRKEIRRTKKLTKGIFGVNIMVALTHYAELVRVAIEEGAPIIFAGGGIARNLPSFLKSNSKTEIIPIVSSARLAVVIAEYWFKRYGYVLKAIVVEGPKAGGHLGFSIEEINDPKFSLENIVSKVIEALKPFEKEHGVSISVIAAGGIYTGEDIYRFLQIGAKGVQMATRFVTTYECEAADEFKQLYIDAKKEDLVIIKSPVGMPGRAIRNKFLDAVAEGKRKPLNCPFHCLKSCDPAKAPYCISMALINAHKGRFSYGYAFAGTNAYRAEKIISVKELMRTIKKEYRAALRVNER